METGQKLCYRCSSLLPEEALFCAQCGSPQLVLTETDAQRIAGERSASPAGSAPMPRASAAGRIRWRPVLHIVAALALIAGAAAGVSTVVPPLSFVATLLVFFGPLLAISLYQRRVPGAPMGAGIGARIGAVLGLLMACVLTAANLAFVLIYRYAMHHGAQMDQKMNAAIRQNMAQSAAAYPAIYANAAQTAQVLQFFQSPDGHATFALMMAALLASGLLAYSALSGAVLGWVRPMPPRIRTGNGR